MPAVGFRRDWPRADERWSVAEDRKLEKLARKFVARGNGRMFHRWEKVGSELGRTPGGVMTRWGILKVVHEHRKAEKK